MQQLHACPVCQSSQYISYISTKAQMHATEEKFNFDQCQECQFVFLNPRVPQKLLKDYYTDSYLPYRGSSAWGKYQNLVESSQFKMDKKRVALAQKYMPQLHSKTKVLDVGCGKPTFLNQLYDQSNCLAHGIDFSDEGWKNTNQQFSNLKLEVKEVKSLETDLKPDLISMWHYLEHDYTPGENLKQLRRLSHTDTQLIIEVPNFDSESRKKYGADWAGWHTPRHTSLFSPSNITRLLEDSGWQVKEILTYGTLDPYVLYWMSEMERKNIDWDKNMEPEFINYVLGMLLFMPKKWMQKSRSLGVMTVIATAY